MSAPITLDSDRMKGLIKNVSSRVNAMKTRQLLQASISRLLKEISYVQDKLVVVKAESETVSTQLRDIQKRLVEPERQLNELTFEKETVLESFSSEGLLEKDIQEKSKQLSELKLKTNQIEEEVTILSITQKEYQSQQRDLDQENQQHTQDMANIARQTGTLASEIHAKKRISELLHTILTGHSDDTLDTQSVVQKYIDDTRAEIDTMSQSMQHALKKIDTIQKELPGLVSEKNRLEKQVNATIAQTGDHYDISQMEKTIQDNKQKNAELIQDNDLKVKEIQTLEAEIAALDEQINAQKETESRSARRYEYLLSQKQKMDAIDDPEKEIARLNSSAAVLQNETHVSQSILTVSSDIRKELTEMKHIFQTNTSFYEEELASMKNALEKLLLANK